MFDDQGASKRRAAVVTQSNGWEVQSNSGLHWKYPTWKTQKILISRSYLVVMANCIMAWDSIRKTLGFSVYVQVNDYEIVVTFFHISHNLT